LVRLKGLKKLKFLDLEGTRVTDAGVKALKDALPGLEIHHKDPFPFSPPGFHLPPELRAYLDRKPAEPIHWENVPWGLLLIIGVLIFLAALAAGFYHARRPG
jgi:hypothetical protein